MINPSRDVFGCKHSQRAVIIDVTITEKDRIKYICKGPANE